MTENLDIDDVADTGDYLLFEGEIEELDDVVDKEEEEFQVIDYLSTLNKIKEDEKKTLPYLTKYEKAKLIGIRSQQLANGAIPLVKTVGLKNTIDIAGKELKERKIPLIIRRFLPNKTYEDWMIDELIF